MATIFVTGGAGYVGSQCCKALARDGWKVVVYDNLCRGWREFVKYGDFIRGDILDGESLRAALKRTRPEVVLHLAGFAYVDESIRDPGLYYRNNMVGTVNVLDAMADVGLSRLIFSSTCATYGVPKTAPIVETTPQHPLNPYGWSKLFAERMLTDFDRAHPLRSVALRYFNAAGADPDGEIGERHDPETRAIPLAIRGAMADDYVFTIFGDDFETRDGTCIRDYIHVADLADGHRRAAQYLIDDGPSDVFNLGTGVGTSVAEVAAAVERVSGKPVAKRIGPRRPGDAPILTASAEKAERILGWRPQYSDIDTIIETAWRWHASEAARFANGLKHDA